MNATFNEIVFVAARERRPNLREDELTKISTLIRAAHFGEDDSEAGSKRKRGHYDREIVEGATTKYLSSALWFVRMPQPKISVKGDPRDACGIGAAFIQVHEEVKGDSGFVRILENILAFMNDRDKALTSFPAASAFMTELSFSEVEWNKRGRIKNGFLFSKTKDMIEEVLSQEPGLI